MENIEELIYDERFFKAERVLWSFEKKVLIKKGFPKELKLNEYYPEYFNDRFDKLYDNNVRKATYLGYSKVEIRNVLACPGTCVIEVFGINTI
jgi:hypothetical protein